MNLGDTIRQGTKWLISGRLAGRVLKFSYGVILARLLVPADFGMLVTMQVFTGIAAFVAGGGMGQALVQSEKVTNKHYHVVFTIQLALCSLIFLMFYFLSPWFALWYDNPLYENLLWVSSLVFLLRPFANIQSSRLHREMRYKSKSYSHILCCYC